MTHLNDRLFLCEKPSQARHVASALGKPKAHEGYYQVGSDIVTYALGHLFEMANPETYDERYRSWKLDDLPIVPSHWKRNTVKKTYAQLKILKDLLKQTQAVYIATDYDREGEAIARDILDYCKVNKPLYRIKLNAMDELSLRQALDHPIPEFHTRLMAEAARARARADWLVGMNLTRYFTLTPQTKFSSAEGTNHIGRVMTPTIAMVVYRDREIQQFKPEPFYVLKAVFLHNEDEFEARWIAPENFCDELGRCLKSAPRNLLAETLHREMPQVIAFENREHAQAAPLCLDLNTCQQIACSRWGYTSREVLQGLQGLYETHRAITYPRTESRYLPSQVSSYTGEILEAVAALDASTQQIVSGITLKRYHEARVFDDNHVDPAHHAIIPTRTTPDISKLSQIELRLYHLVARYFAAQFYPDHVQHKSKATIDAGGAIFKATGSQVRVLGWKAVLGSALTRIAVSAARDDTNPNPLPYMQVGDPLKLVREMPSDHVTSPPDHFTEATLIAAMKNIGRHVADEAQRKALEQASGLGTAATRADIIHKSVERGYLARAPHQKTIRATARANALIASLPQSVTSPATTAIWEMKLDQVANGVIPTDRFVDQIASWVSDICRGN